MDASWILVMIVSIMVALPDGKTTTESYTLETRYYKSQESCESTGKLNKDTIATNHIRKAFMYRAIIKELDIEHLCLNEEQAL